MSRGPSGRIVVEVDPDLKRRLYTALTHDGTTLKDWFITEAEQYLASYSQLRLPLAAEPVGPPYVRRKRKP